MQMITHPRPRPHLRPTRHRHGRWSGTERREAKHGKPDGSRYTQRKDGKAAHFIQISETLADDFDRLAQISLFDDEWWCEAHAGYKCVNGFGKATSTGVDLHVNVRGFREYATALQQQAELPCRASLTLLLAIRFIDYDRIQQSPAADVLNKGGLEVTDRRAEEFAKNECTFSEALLHQNIQSGHGYCTAKGVSMT